MICKLADIKTPVSSHDTGGLARLTARIGGRVLFRLEVDFRQTASVADVYVQTWRGNRCGQHSVAARFSVVRNSADRSRWSVTTQGAYGYTFFAFEDQKYRDLCEVPMPLAHWGSAKSVVGRTTSIQLTVKTGSSRYVLPRKWDTRSPPSSRKNSRDGRAWHRLEYGLSRSSRALSSIALPTGRRSAPGPQSSLRAIADQIFVGRTMA